MVSKIPAEAQEVEPARAVEVRLPEVTNQQGTSTPMITAVQQAMAIEKAPGDGNRHVVIFPRPQLQVLIARALLEVVACSRAPS